MIQEKQIQEMAHPAVLSSCSMMPSAHVGASSSLTVRLRRFTLRIFGVDGSTPGSEPSTEPPAAITGGPTSGTTGTGCAVAILELQPGRLWRWGREARTGGGAGKRGGR